MKTNLNYIDNSFLEFFYGFIHDNSTAFFWLAVALIAVTCGGSLIDSEYWKKKEEWVCGTPKIWYPKNVAACIDWVWVIIFLILSRLRENFSSIFSRSKENDIAVPYVLNNSFSDDKPVSEQTAEKKPDLAPAPVHAPEVKKQPAWKKPIEDLTDDDLAEILEELARLENYIARLEALVAWLRDLGIWWFPFDWLIDYKIIDFIMNRQGWYPTEAILPVIGTTCSIFVLIKIIKKFFIERAKRKAIVLRAKSDHIFIKMAKEAEIIAHKKLAPEVREMLRLQAVQDENTKAAAAVVKAAAEARAKTKRWWKFWRWFRS